MSWHFSLALAAGYSEASCLDGELSAEWRSTPSALDDSCSDKMKGTCHLSRYGTMYAPSTGTLGVALLTWYLAASPAPTYHQPERRPASRERQAGYGGTWSGSFTKFDPDSHGWRTLQTSLTGDLATFSQPWPRWGLMRGGECWDLTSSAPITSACGPGSWPTPCHGSSRWGGTFQEVGGSQNKLRNTPTGKLYVNPDFWESLMGWPIGWTGTAPLETAKTHAWLQQHGAS